MTVNYECQAEGLIDHFFTINFVVHVKYLRLFNGTLLKAIPFVPTWHLIM